MTVAYTAPGVYVRELQPGSRTITGVSTSLTAFVGPARRGPVDTPTRIFSFADFERSFGGLWAHSPMSQAVRQYFASGGSEALIVRVVNRDAVGGNAAARASVVLPSATGTMTLRATADALALPGLHHLTLTVGAVAGPTFDLTVQARDANGTVLSGTGGDFEYTVGLDVSGDVAADLAAATTTATEAITLVELVTDAMTVVPDAGTVTSYADAGVHYATLSATTGLTLTATAGATALVGFDRLRLRVVGTGGTTFGVLVQALDASGTVLDDGGSPAEYTVGLDAAGGIPAALAGAQTTNGTTLVSAAGGIAQPPTDGVYETSQVGLAHVARLSVGLALAARNEGAWGNRLRAAVSVLDASAGAFHLVLSEVDADGEVVATEVFYNLTLGAADTRSVEQVLALESRLGVVAGTVPSDPPAYTAAPISLIGGEDGAAPRLFEDVQGNALGKTGMQALRDADLFNLLCIPLDSWSSATQPEVDLWQAGATLCEELRAVLLVDPPREWTDAAAAATAASTFSPRSANAALYFPRVFMADPLAEGRIRDFPPCGVVAGVIARTDAERGIWKAPAGTEATLRGVPALGVKMTDAQQGTLNPLGINCLRSLPVYGPVVWGARTLHGADALASQWKYLPVRRLALYLEESLRRGTQWAVFEPNAEPLWGQLRLNIGSFMQGMFREGAFAGTSARTAYFVKCDAETTPPEDVARGIVNVVIGFAPLRPAEFVIIKLQQITAQAD